MRVVKAVFWFIALIPLSPILLTYYEENYLLFILVLKRRLIC